MGLASGDGAPNTSDAAPPRLPQKALVQIVVRHCLAARVSRILRLLPCRIIVRHCYYLLVEADVLVDSVLVAAAAALSLEKAAVEHGPPLTLAAHYFMFVPLLEAASHSSVPLPVEHSADFPQQ